MTWQPSDEQQRQYQRDGYFIVPHAIERDTAIEVRGVIRDHILKPEHEVGGNQRDPMDPMGDSPEARAARFRKLGQLCVTSPLIWHTIHAGPLMPRIAQHFLGDDLLLKFNSCFLKPARTGSATPWHQDNGLWRDGETQPFNFWIAIDPATKANGCMQFIPGTHREPIETHGMYEGSIHGELPRQSVAACQAKYGLHHIELAPGDAVCWHSSLYHYSPPNTSECGRIAVAGVYSTPALADRNLRFKRYEWVMRGGAILGVFPPQMHEASGEAAPLPKFPDFEPTAVARRT
ncbi:MAG: phytanoyl-CoA dioxygenase family protein [Phycisphaeraceae bacterium]